jgi:hypothetical protein
MLEILKRLYLGHERGYLDFIMRNLETDKAMNDGARYGGQDAAWARLAPSPDKPVALRRYWNVAFAASSTACG